ncbi:ABC transporter permease subunit [Nakamurella sp. YIM 132087]|uniref:ABC transporter permease subunit n=1 Tax=Nakamurella alba TaxID=2665158 RepID=A0A7K1FQ03_9ACTN|nr:ABC transporter permease subunit [Nakamurella alba]MTD15323.1 ABC transporter permease subunit [Nakamurella alba]
MAAPTAPGTTQAPDAPSGITPPPGPVRRRGWPLGTGATVLLGTLVVWIVLWKIFDGRWNLDIGRSELTPLHRTLNDVNDWVGANRDTSPVFLYFFNYIQLGIEGAADFFTQLFSHTDVGRELPEIGWLGTTALLTAVAFVVGNARVAALTLVGLLVIVAQGLWAEAMDTFSLVALAVLLALIIGLPLGIWAGVNSRVNKIVTPVLDFMQILPAFAYLAPLALIFMIGPAPAVVTTWIYAIPPVIRLTAHGIRQVPATTREAVDSLGAGGVQRLRTMLLPMAKRTIVIGINQTIMAALSMVTIAALIGAPGLGLSVTQALQTLDVGAALNAGIAIVLLAIIFDRVTTAASVRSENLRRAAPHVRLVRRYAVIGALVLAVVAIYLSRTMLWAAEPPVLPDLGEGIATVGNTVAQWLQDNLAWFTQSMRDNLTEAILNPLQDLLSNSPWFVVGAVLVVLGYLAGRIRVAVIAAVGVGLMVLLGVWNDAMVTLAATLLATVFVMILGVVFGVWMGRSSTADKVIRPLLDAAQTMPPFVYLVPFLALFGSSRFTAIIAAVVYAAPAAIKIITDGISQVPSTTVEAAISTGSTNWQVITKVQIPMAAKSIGLAFNQGLIYSLSMVVIGGMVGAGALGYDVIAGLNQLDLFGKGLSAGLTLVVMGIVLDRITQAAADRSGRASGPAIPPRRKTTSGTTDPTLTATAPAAAGV